MENKIKISEEQFKADCIILAEIIRKEIAIFNIKIENIYGIPRGGEYVAKELSAILNIPISNRITPQTIVVDDLIDSGKTIANFYGKYPCFNMFYVLYKKPHSIIRALPTSFNYVTEHNGWIEFWYEDTNTDDENLIVRMLERIGENPNREGLVDTPKRVVKMWEEIFRGYDEAQKPNITIFDNNCDGVEYDQMVYDKGYFFSHCEHHMVPFFGEYFFAYIPGEKVIGLSKIARIIDFYSAKLQIQERLVKEVVDEIEKVAKPIGIALIMKGRHLCKEMRGVKKINGEMITSDLRGSFKDNQLTREEFLRLCKL